MGIDHHCRWVRHRLPLLAGGELGIEERRRVERHLIGCLGCRDHRDASTDALAALRSLAEESPSSADAPSLWPALAIQIRQSRHVTPRPSWWEIPFPHPRAALGLGLASGLLGMAVAASLVPPSGREAPRSSAPSVDVAPVEIQTVALTSRRGALPSGPARPTGALPQNGGNPYDPPSIPQFNYDLDHGTPMGPGDRDPQHSY